MNNQATLHNKDYGLSKNDLSYCSVPYSHVDTPLEGSKFSDNLLFIITTFLTSKMFYFLLRMCVLGDQSPGSFGGQSVRTVELSDCSSEKNVLKFYESFF